MQKCGHFISRYLFLLVFGLVMAVAGANSASAAQVIYSGWCADGVSNNPTVDTVFTLTEPTNIAAIYNYHYNDGMGQDASLVAGTIGIDQLVSETESSVIGRWPATSWSTQPGSVTNTGWVAYPNILLGPGTYKVVDSDPATWSNSYGGGGNGPDWGAGKGFTHIETSAGVTATQPVNNAVNVALTQPLTVTFSQELISGAYWDQIVDRNVIAGYAFNQIEVSFFKNNGVRTIIPTTKTVDGNSVVITPVEPYRTNTLYTVMLPAGSVTDILFLPSAAYQFDFKTGNQ